MKSEPANQESIPEEILQSDQCWNQCSQCLEHSLVLIDGLCPDCDFLNRLLAMAKKALDGIVIDEHDVIKAGDIDHRPSWEWDTLLKYQSFVIRESDFGWEYFKKEPI